VSSGYFIYAVCVGVFSSIATKALLEFISRRLERRRTIKRRLQGRRATHIVGGGIG
jgi:hypothetical protein